MCSALLHPASSCMQVTSSTDAALFHTLLPLCRQCLQQLLQELVCSTLQLHQPPLHSILCSLADDP